MTAPPPIPPALRPAIERALPGVAIEAARPLGEGWGAFAYRLPAAPGDRGGDWALRLRRPESFRAVTGDIEREVCLLPALEAAGLPTPREARPVLDDGGELAGTVHRLVEGIPAARVRLRSSTARERLAADLGAFLSALHAFPAEEAIACGVPDLDLWPGRYAPMFEECWRLLGPRSRMWLDATAERFLAEGAMDGAPRTLVHGDFGASHILLGEDGALAGVIDFGDAMVADPAIDFGALLITLGERFTDRVLAHYRGEVDAHFRRRARFYADVVPIFLVRFGHLFGDGEERRAGLRQFAARAARAARARRLGEREPSRRG